MLLMTSIPDTHDVLACADTRLMLMPFPVDSAPLLGRV
jgi:hypothetical protein